MLFLGGIGLRLVLTLTIAVVVRAHRFGSFSQKRNVLPVTPISPAGPASRCVH